MPPTDPLTHPSYPPPAFRCTGSVIAVSHDRYFLRRIATRIVTVDDGKLVDYQGDYEVGRGWELVGRGGDVGGVRCRQVLVPSYEKRCMSSAALVAPCFATTATCHPWCAHHHHRPPSL